MDHKILRTGLMTSNEPGYPLIHIAAMLWERHAIRFDKYPNRLYVHPDHPDLKPDLVIKGMHVQGRPWMLPNHYYATYEEGNDDS